jgi:hypothetical protein
MAKTVTTIVKCDACEAVLQEYIRLEVEYNPVTGPPVWQQESEKYFCNLVCLKNFYVLRGALHG